MNISASNEAMQVKLGRDVAPYEIYQMVHILMLLLATCSVPVPSYLKSNITICSCTGQNIQLKMLKRRPNEGETGMCLRQDQVFCFVELQMVIFHFEEAGDWNQVC